MRRESGVRGASASGVPAPATATAAGELPFTGLSALLVGLVGLLMALAGVLVRNLTERPAY